MFVIKSPVTETKQLQENIFLQKIHCPEIASVIKAGQFLNVRVLESTYPLLRRPFSICDVEDDYIYLLFNVMGEGTIILSHKPEGALIDLLGPLGKGFNTEDDYELAVIAAGGLGAAPFPFLTKELKDKKEIKTFVGGRSKSDVITYGMINVSVATDDGSAGYKGTVVDLMRENLQELKSKKIKVFACGPTPMLRAVKEFCVENDFNCEVSTECAMACGFGICQGCPIESANEKDKYLLVCKDGPVFNIKDVML